ncbi:MAG TPA: ATP-grasp domain-containing protein [Thermodesulfobacteriota bacterium]|nr:ATP-grasp domain-containing protein [Thermodesulfobacteriota bacterium]
MARVLVTDGHFRKTLAVVRSLGRKGVQVTVGERTYLNTSFFSRYCTKRLIYPSPRQSPNQFIEFFLREIRNNRYDCVFPMEEETLLPLARHHSEISQYTYFLSPDIKKIEFVRDKGNLMQFAEKTGIPAPRTFYAVPSRGLSDGGGEEGKTVGTEGEGGSLSSVPLPAVIKPRISSGSLGIVYVKKEGDLIPSYRRVHERFPFPIIQEWIPDGGGVYGFSALYDEASSVKAAFVHRKLRMYPVQGGPSTLGEGVEHPRLMEMGLALFNALNWVGVGMAEFKVDPRDGIPKLMEINPRFWGSLQLAVASGVDFPYLMLKMAKRERFEPILHYAVGKRFRWLLLGDLLHFVDNPNRFRLHPSFFDFFDPNTFYDILSKDDPLPFLGSMATLSTFLYDQEMKRFLGRR